MKKVTVKKQLICVAIFALAVRVLFILLSLAFAEGNLVSRLATVWSKWDANHYVNIARNGYAGALEDGRPIFLVFFPMYPQLLGLIASWLPDLACKYEIIGMCLSTLCYVGGCLYFYCLCEQDYGKKVAWYAVIFLSLFPFSFFFGGIMTEGMFFLFTAATLYYIREHRWCVAGVAGAFACATRMMGLVLLVAGLMEWITTYHPIRLLRRKRFPVFMALMVRRFLPLLIMLLGTIYYLGINVVVTGNPLAFQHYQRDHWSQGYQFIGKSLRFIVENIVASGIAGEQSIAIWWPDLVLFIVFLIVIVFAFRKVRPMYTAYIVVYLLLNYSISMPFSCGRYLSCGLPIFLMLSVLLKKHMIERIVVIALSAVLLGFYAALYMSGGLVM